MIVMRYRPRDSTCLDRQMTTIQEVTESAHDQAGQKFCFSCSREEKHYPVARGIAPVLAVLTLGLAFIVWPFECRCCGSLRPRFWPR